MGGLVVCSEDLRVVRDRVRGSRGPLGKIRLLVLDTRSEGTRDTRGNRVGEGKGLNAIEGRRGGRVGSRRGTSSGLSPQRVSNVVERVGFFLVLKLL